MCVLLGQAICSLANLLVPFWRIFQLDRVFLGEKEGEVPCHEHRLLLPLGIRPLPAWHYNVHWLWLAQDVGLST